MSIKIVLIEPVEAPVPCQGIIVLPEQTKATEVHHREAVPIEMALVPQEDHLQLLEPQPIEEVPVPEQISLTEVLPLGEVITGALHRAEVAVVSVVREAEVLQEVAVAIEAVALRAAVVA